jgi:hypothetical protein
MKEPTIIQKQARDVTPYYHGIWCSIGDGKPFINPIVHRRWSNDGTKVLFGLDSHNFYSAKPDQWISVVEIEPSCPPSVLERNMKRDAAEMANIPQLINCPHCKGKGKIWSSK